MIQNVFILANENKQACLNIQRFGLMLHFLCNSLHTFKHIYSILPIPVVFAQTSSEYASTVAQQRSWYSQSAF